MDGAGTDSDPYLITDWNDFTDLRTLSSGDYHFQLTTNLDFAEYGAAWIPIGTAASPFCGTFDGNGYVISNFTLETPDKDDVGFFGVIENSAIYDLNFENATVVGNNSVGILAGHINETHVSEIGIYKSNVTAFGDNAGGIIGSAEHIPIDFPSADSPNIHTAYVLNSNVTAENNAGGVIGFSLDVSVINSHLTNSSVIAKNSSAGGIAGKADSSFYFESVDWGWGPTEYYHYYSEISAFSVSDSEILSKYDAGGVAGTANNITFFPHIPYFGIGEKRELFYFIPFFSVLSSNITASEDNAGGIIGNSSSVSLYGSSSYGELFISVSGCNITSKNNAGGVIGNAYNPLYENVSSSFISSISVSSKIRADENNAGGIVGNITGNEYLPSVIESCHLVFVDDILSASEVYANTNAGGIAGSAVYSDIQSVIVSAPVNSKSVSGGVIGYLEHSELYSSVSSSPIKSDSIAGGLVGYMNNSSIFYSSSSGSVESTDSIAGGLVGYMNHSSIFSSFSSASIESDSIAGGLIGEAENSEIFFSYSVSPVSATSESGGFAGIVNDSIISDSYTIGSVSGGSNNIGGFIGLIADSGSGTTIERSYAANPLPNSNPFIGGGGTGVDLVTCFYLSENSIIDPISNLNFVNETDMKKYSTFENVWDDVLNYYIFEIFNSTGGNPWVIADGCFYPQLDWQESYNYVIEIGTTSAPVPGAVSPQKQLGLIGKYRLWQNPSNPSFDYYGFPAAPDKTGELKYWAPGATYIVTEDIDMSEDNQFIYPEFYGGRLIGDKGNGAMPTISNLSYVPDPEGYYYRPTLFGSFSNSSLSNIHFSNIAVDENDNPSGLLRFEDASISNVRFSNITSEKTNFIFISSFYNSSVSDLQFSDIKLDGANNSGLFGSISGSFISDIQLSNVTISGTEYVGGLTGYASNSLFLNCTADDKSTVSGYKAVGGLIGLSDGNIIDRCKFSGNVTGTNLGFTAPPSSITNIGGIVGFLPMYPETYLPYSGISSSMTNCIFDGNVTALYDSRIFDPTNSILVSNIGGIVGGNFHVGTVTGAGHPGDVGILFEYVPLDFIVTPLFEFYDVSSGTGSNFFDYLIPEEKSLFITKLDSEKLRDCLPDYVYFENCTASGNVLVQDLTPSNITFPPMILGVGGFAGSLVTSHIENSTATGNVSIYGVNENSKTQALLTSGIGGFSGMTIAGTINESNFKGNLTVQGSDYVNPGYYPFPSANIFTGCIGGMSGLTLLTGIENSFSEGNITVTESKSGGISSFFSSLGGGVSAVAGLAFSALPDSNYMELLTYSSHFSTGSIGGLTGFSALGIIDNSYMSGNVDVSGAGTGATGGLIGFSIAEFVTDSFVSGDVSVVGPYSLGAGGISGIFTLGGLENCYVTGDVLLADAVNSDSSIDFSTSVAAGGLIGIFLENENTGVLVSELVINLLQIGAEPGLIISDRAMFVNNFALNEFVRSAIVDNLLASGTESISGPVIGLYSFYASYSSGFGLDSPEDSSAFTALNTTVAWKNMSDQHGILEHSLVKGIPTPSRDVWNKLDWIGIGDWKLGNFVYFKLPIHSYMETSFAADAKHLIPVDVDEGSGSGGGKVVGNNTSGGKIIEPEDPKYPDPVKPAEQSLKIILLFMFGVALFCFRFNMNRRDDRDEEKIEEEFENEIEDEIKA